MGGGWERIDENEMGATGRGSVRNMWGMERDLWIESVALLMNASFEVLSISRHSEGRRGDLRVQGNLDFLGACYDDLGA
jgi:hypothetical protein